MKTKLIPVLFFGILATYSSAFAIKGEGRDPSDRKPVKSEPEIVKWIGEVKDDASNHTTRHGHELEFVKKDDGKEYDIVDSPDLQNLHHETGKNFLVEIEAEKTPRFLFWGGNLIVKNFKVLEETSDAVRTAVRSQILLFFIFVVIVSYCWQLLRNCSL